MIACYCRVSSRHQKNESQKSKITRWLTGHGINASQVCWFEDKESGRTLACAAFDELQRAIFAGEVKTVVVWKLDRISRRLRDGVNLLTDWCDKGIRVVVVTQQIDLSGAVGRMVASVLFGLAEIELEFRRERQMAGIRVAKSRGADRGPQKSTFKASPHRAIELSSRGLSPQEISAALGVSERTVFRYLVRAS